MSLFKSSNPALRVDTFEKSIKTATDEGVMTIQGTVNKTAILALITFASSIYTWNLLIGTNESSEVKNLAIIASVLGLIVALIIIFSKRTAPYLAPVYCFLQGLMLGAISALMENSFPGIVLQAITLTFTILFSLLLIYRLGIIKATENFKLIVGSATLGICAFYLISLIGGFFGLNLPLIHDNGIGGILFSLFVVIIAALNLVVDFDFIEKGAEMKAPKYMEWYGAFGLMVTIIWLYLEILRLLGKARSRN